MVHQAKNLIAALLSGSIAFGLAYFYCRLLGFFARATVGEGPQIADQHAAQNEIVFGCIGGLWVGGLAARWTYRRLKRPPDVP
jgi:hypothetical protein